MQNVKSISKLIVLFAIALGALLLVALKPVGAQPSTVYVQPTATATSTVTYMTAGTATTTYQIDSPSFSSTKITSNQMQQVDAAAMYIEWISAQATSTLAYQVQVSNNNIDWYGVNSLTSATPANSTTNGGQWFLSSSTANMYYYTPGVGGNASSTNFTVIMLPSIPATHERVVFSVPSGSPAGSIYAEFDLKKLPSN